MKTTLSPGVQVKRSNIHGRGVFAVRPFRRGEIVLRYDRTHVISAAQVRTLPARDQRYVSRLDPRRYFVQQSPARYVNHSCDPNTRSNGRADIARRPIRRGEEITADYGREWILGSFHCRCGSPRCRRMIGAA